MPGSKLIDDSIWLLLGARAGDNAQARALADMLGVPVKEKHLKYNLLYRLPNLFKGASLASLDVEARLEIKPPWPKMVIATGRRSVAVARYIQKQSGGKTKLVQLGNPRANARIFDLVVTTPQYGVLAGENVVELPVPIVAIEMADDAEAKIRQEMLGQGKPKPFIVVLAGGNSRPQKFTPESARELVASATHQAQKLGGTLFVLSSPRTPKDVLQVFREEISEPHVFLPWEKSQSGAKSPYVDMLSMADEIIVTSDSASMISDVLTLKGSVKIFELPSGLLGRWVDVQRYVFGKLDKYCVNGWMWSRVLGLWVLLRKYGLLNSPRHMKVLINNLCQTGIADAFPKTSTATEKRLKSAELQGNLDVVLKRLKGLLESFKALE